LFASNSNRILRLEDNTVIKPFDCGDSDLNDFLFNDAKNYRNSLLSNTYILENDGDTIGYYSLINDKIERNEEDKSVWNKLNRNVPFNKRRRTYPAVKIGRLAVSEKYKGLKFGNLIVDYIIRAGLEQPHFAGFRFITVDAYIKATGFYEKNGFRYLTDKDKNDDTRTMFLDLLSIKEV